MERKITLFNICLIKLRNTDLAPRLNTSGAITLLAFYNFMWTGTSLSFIT